MHIKSEYSGQLRTSATHLASNNSIITDAPVDNHGKGEAFSPTDLVASALTSCMMTIMGIVAEKRKVDLSGLSANTTKIMQNTPRKIAEVKIEFHWEDCVASEEDKKILKERALTCPVALSLKEDVLQNVTFNF